MKILVDGRDVIVAKAEGIREVENGYLVIDTIYPSYLTLHETDEHVIVQKHKYIDGHVVDNDEYTQVQPNTIEYILEKFKTSGEILESVVLVNLTFKEVVTLKINALKESCTNSIYAGFKSETLNASFGFNDYDQTNFTQQLLLIVASGGKYTKTIEWKTLEGEIVKITSDKFIALVDEAETHKRTQQSKYWTLEEQVKLAQTKEEILSIKW